MPGPMAANVPTVIKAAVSSAAFQENVDLVIVKKDPHNVVAAKQAIVKANPMFGFIPSSIPRIEQRKLYYLPTNQGEYCIVNIDSEMIAGWKIPFIPKTRVKYLHPWVDLPIMPILLLLLTKLHRWDHARLSKETRMVAKAQQNVMDVEDLLDLAVKHEVTLKSKKQRWITDDPTFKKVTQTRILEFVKKYPESRKHWVGLGFDA
ncbi:hypothetical protein VNI00_009712 [Paramarasmius palmivorus]|uniref:Uncharacterized protein n=1 Tax=Paramarasmius palmivorus TaxID=297713 RepID=A0AAW0CK65_9AGAR